MKEWSWQLLRAGAFRLDGGAMFGVIPKALWSNMTAPDDANRIALQTNCVLLQRDDHKVLIETGFGNKFGEKDKKIFALQERWIGQALEDVGISREEITAVVVTHLHFDHAGGLTYFDTDDADASPKPSFPNAKIFTQRTEWEDAKANKSTMTKAYLSDHLYPVEDQIVLVDGEAEIIPGITVKPVPGHTWGQQSVRFRDEQGFLCFPGDVMPTIHHAGAPFNMAYDMLPHQNMLTKAALLEQASQDNWRIITDHEPDQAVVSVEKDERGRFHLSPVAP